MISPLIDLISQLCIMLYRRYRQSLTNIDGPTNSSSGYLRSIPPQATDSGSACISVTNATTNTESQTQIRIPIPPCPPHLASPQHQQRAHGNVKRKKKRTNATKSRKSVDSSVVQSPPPIPLQRNITCLSNSGTAKFKSKKLPAQTLISSERINELALTSIRQSMPIDSYNEPKKKLPLLVAIKPVNERSERDRFMKSNYNYNPYFAYRGYAEELEKFKHPSDKYINQAVLIMERAIEHFGCYEAFEEETGGRILSKAQICNLVKKYLNNEELEEEIIVNLRDDLLSRGSMTRSKGRAVLNVRCVNLRENWADGLLRHEIGTHYLRSCNTRHQPWHSHRVRRELGMGPINPTEEGLASLHSVLFRTKPYMWRAALLYYTSYMGSKLSFKELFHNLSKYVHNPDVRWDYCLRAKRGQVDTGRPGSFSKDQVYLEGALQLLKRRHLLDFPLLVRLGKVSWEDVDRDSIVSIARLDKTRIPWFMDDLNVYRRQLEWIAKTNGLTDAVLSTVD